MANDDPAADWITELIVGEPKYTPDEIAEASGMSVDEAERLWIELGFQPVDSNTRHFTDADVEVLKMLADLQRSWPIDPEVIISMTRVLGQALSRVAYAQAENLQTTAVVEDASGTETVSQELSDET